MKTFDGYSKEKFSDTSVLLAGGGSKELSNFIGTLNWDSTNRKLQYKKIGDTNWSDLATFGSNALNSISYLPLTGGAINGNLIVNGNTTFKCSTSLSAIVTDGDSNIVFDTLNNQVYAGDTSLLLASFKNGGTIYGTLTAVPNEEQGLYYNNHRLLTEGQLYWANIPISTTSSTTTDPTFRYPTSIYSKFTNGSEIIGFIGRGGDNNNLLFGNYKNADVSIYTNDNPSSNCICLKTGGNVGIGTTNPLEKLEVSGNIRVINPSYDQVVAKILNYPLSPYGLIIKLYASGAVHLQSQRENNNSEVFPLLLNPNGGNVGIGNTTSPSYKLHIVGNAAATHFYEDSDIRFKTNFSSIDISINQLSEIPLFDFDWINNNLARNTGTSAQAVQKILPNLVSGTNKLTLDYGVLGTIAGITACKELVNLKSEIDLLKKRIELLELQLKMINTYGEFNSD